MKCNFGLKNQILRTANAKKLASIATVAATLLIMTNPSFHVVQPALAQTARPESPDFNGDGKADLAIGVPNESVGTIRDAGAVNVLYGTTSGISSANDQFWSQASSGILETAESGDHFGHSIATGDFDGDGFSDLAAGVPGENVGSTPGGGAVNVIYGSSSRLTSTDDQVWSQNSAGVLDSAECHEEPEEGIVCDSFGSSVAAGDFNGDGQDDLAIGTPDEDICSVVDAGAVDVLYGSSSGITAEGDDFWHQDVSGVESSAEAGDNFGAGLAAGDFNRDGFVDLATGVPHEGVEDKTNIGAVSVLFGSSSGLTATGDQFWTQDSSGILDTAERDDSLGNALTSGDFDGDGFADLAIGVSHETIGTSGEQAQGAVNVIYGSSSGLSSNGDQFWNQDSPGIEGTAISGGEFGIPLFGESLGTGDYNGDGSTDLDVGVPQDFIGDHFHGGAVNVLYGSSAAGLTATNDQLWSQDSPGVEDTIENSDQFGDALSKEEPTTG
jgi:FG-GAP repeat protein